MVDACPVPPAEWKRLVGLITKDYRVEPPIHLCLVEGDTPSWKKVLLGPAETPAEVDTFEHISEEVLRIPEATLLNAVAALKQLLQTAQIETRVIRALDATRGSPANHQ